MTARGCTPFISYQANKQLYVNSQQLNPDTEEVDEALLGFLGC